VATRIITGLILAPLLIWAVLMAPKLAMIIVLALACARCTDELLRMYPECRREDRVVAALLATGISVSTLLGGVGLWLAIGVAPVVWLSYCLVRPGDVEIASRRAALGMLALGYVGILIGMLIAIYQHGTAIAPETLGVTTVRDVGRGGLMSVFLMVFMGDTGAYFAGRAFGKHKLYELISPKKTMEGALGGLLASMLGGWLTSRYLVPMPASSGLLLGATCGAVGQIGDLVESLFKRATRTKDSGQLLPGHGGLLDRVDGVLFAAPVVQLWLLVAP
jgi:phosphatidate cytidylyltransferase